ncbi:hypothetical protein DUZ99_04195 [Xylanibacillus composti]|uniref:Uncharacterized protein n=1 Tax=Xylanibacillus composti TaxID=1572762 RepID=A0A8J4GZV8_9BACL|nr:hypothetical protein [Xylanibacillus composti]GIQ68297.1 hypothetical protein XYCOK13_11210 [Xylanibacillus composti]
MRLHTHVGMQQQDVGEGCLKELRLSIRSRAREIAASVVFSLQNVSNRASTWYNGLVFIVR